MGGYCIEVYELLSSRCGSFLRKLRIVDRFIELIWSEMKYFLLFFFVEKTFFFEFCMRLYMSG